MEGCSIYTLFLSILGCLALIRIFSDTLWNMMQNLRSILGPFFLPDEPTTLSNKFGSWALVTGSTDGIGKAYAEELAKRGVNIVLVSRSEDKLLKTANEIEKVYNVKTKIITADFSKGAMAIEIVRKEIGHIPIGILVNNVGKQYNYPMRVGEVMEEDLWDIININVGAVTMMTRLFLNQMVKRGKGAIVNVSSGAECQPLPFMTVYSATKVYVQSFTEALRFEYSKFGITVQHLSPLFIATKMNLFSDKLQETSLFVPDATTYAKNAVCTLGRVDHSTGYWPHGIQYFFTTVPPKWFRMYVGALMNKSFRREYLQREKGKVITQL